MEKSFQFDHYQITVQWEGGFLVQICDLETKEVWESEPHLSATEAVNQADKVLLWYFEAFDNRNCEERQTFREQISHLAEQMRYLNGER